MTDLQAVRKVEPTPLHGTPAVKISGLSKRFHKGGEVIQVLEGLDLEIATGRFEALMGPSGSGKSTLLNVIAGLDRPSTGSIVVAGQDLTKLGDAALSKWRSTSVGLVFQSHNLLPVLTALENVQLPLALRKVPRAERRARAETALALVGLADRHTHYPSQLSGGQEQRVSIARAIVHDPELILADEPTGEVDRERADEILVLLEKLAREFGKTVLMVTHDPVAAERADRIHHLDKGKLA